MILLTSWTGRSRNTLDSQRLPRANCEAAKIGARLRIGHPDGVSVQSFDHLPRLKSWGRRPRSFVGMSAERFERLIDVFGSRLLNIIDSFLKRS